MKTITPVSVWFNGQEVQASVLNASCSLDNLVNLATFNYQLMQIILIDNLEYTVPVVNGQQTMSGTDYDAWETNEYAFNWIASQLNLTITGEYVKPVPTTTTSTTTEAPVTTTTTTTTEEPVSTTTTTTTEA
jgi:hypothetical protein